MLKNEYFKDFSINEGTPAEGGVTPYNYANMVNFKNGFTRSSQSNPTSYNEIDKYLESIKSKLDKLNEFKEIMASVIEDITEFKKLVNSNVKDYENR